MKTPSGVRLKEEKLKKKITWQFPLEQVLTNVHVMIFA